MLLHHPKLNTYTLTLEDVPGSPPPNIQNDVEEIQRLIQSHQKEDSPVQRKPALLILDRDLSNTTETVECIRDLQLNSLDPSTESQKTLKTFLNSSGVADELCPCQNGTGDHAQSREEEAETQRPTVGDTEKASDKPGCAELLSEADPVSFSAPSCGNQGEEADIQLNVISAKQEADKGNQEELQVYQSSSESETECRAQPGNLEFQDMGNAQGHSPLPTETSQSRQREEGSMDGSWKGDLPEEKEGETSSSSQDIVSNSTVLSSHDSEENIQHNDKIETELATECCAGQNEPTCPAIQVISEVASPVLNNENVIFDAADELHIRLETEAGSLHEHPKGNTDSDSGLVDDEVSIKQKSGYSSLEGDTSELVSLLPNMAPGPIHKVRGGLSPVPETLFTEGPAVDTVSETVEDLDQSTMLMPSSETTSEILLNEKAGDSDTITVEALPCLNQAFISEGIKEVTPSEEPGDPGGLFANNLISDTENIAVCELVKQPESLDETSNLPVDSESFIKTDIQKGVSVLSPEHSEKDIIIGTTLGDEEESKTNVQQDSLMKQVLDEQFVDGTNRNEIYDPCESSIVAPEVSALKMEPGEKNVTQEEKEIDSTSQEAISNLPDLLESVHVIDTESKEQTQLPESSMEGVITDLHVDANDLVEGLPCALTQMESSESSRPFETSFTDVVSDGSDILNETAVTENSPATFVDAVSDLVLEDSSISGPHNSSSLTDELTSPLDIISEEHKDFKHTSLVDIDNSLSVETKPSDTTESLSGLQQDTTEGLMEQNETVKHGEEETHAQKTDGTLAEDAVDGHQDSSAHTENSEAIHRETETFFAVDASRVAGVENKSSSESSEFHPPTPSPESVRHEESASTMRGSVSDGDSLLSQDLSEDIVFTNKAEDSVTSTSGVSMSYSSSTDDTSSLGTPSVAPQPGTETPGSDVFPALPASPGASSISGETEEEERKDCLTEVPERSAILRPSIRSLSPIRRHSWGPGKNSAGEMEMTQRSTARTEVERRSGGHRRSMSWCPSVVLHSEGDEINGRSYSLEGLTAEKEGRESAIQRVDDVVQEPNCPSKLDREERGSLVSLTEEEQEDKGDYNSLSSQKSIQAGRRNVPPANPILTKSVSMLAISHKDLDGLASFTGTSGSLEYSISEEDPGPLRSDSEGKGGGTKVSRTFSYLKNKMSKRSKEKDKEKNKERERDARDKERRASHGHLFSASTTAPTVPCHQCNKPINTKDAFLCTSCNAHVHKGCRESLPVCAKVKMKQKQQQSVPDGALTPAVPLRNKTLPARERPWSAISIPDDMPAPIAPPRKSPSSIMSFNSIPLSKSMSINNIAGHMEEASLKSLRFLSQSTDSLHKTSKVTESTESLTDEGTEMMDNQLMGEFEADVKDLEADSWSFMVDKKYLKHLKKDTIKRQDVIYELIQTEMHHVRTLKIMADVYSKGLQREVQLEVQTVEKMFPMLEDLLDLHTQFFTHLIERKKEAASESQEEGRFVIRKIGDMLVSQFSGSNAERMKKIYGKFCSRHNEAVNFYKELHTKDKRFQAFIRKKMSSPIVRRLGIPECILLVTQRITKYPVLLQRILQHTKEEEDHADVTQGLKLVKEVIAAVDNKVNDHEKKKRLKEVYSRTDSKSIMRMKSGQMFAKEDLLRGQKLIHDGPLQLKNAAGRLKDVQALLLRDVIVFLQEKDQKFVFAALDQRSTVISLQKLILREVANEEKGLFLITAGIEKPEMVEVYASSKEERNTWMQLIQEAMQSMERDDDEGVPSENEEDKRLQEIKVREMKDQLQKRDEQILALLEEKVKLFRDICDCGVSDETGSNLRSRMLFRATPDDITKGEPIMKDALKEVETLQVLVNGRLGGAVQDGVYTTGPVSLPRRAETFGGFDSHQMNISKIKDGDRDDTEDSTELRRTESDSVLKKTSNTNPIILLKRNNEQVLQSVAHLHDLLNTLQAVVIQQDTFIEDQRLALSDRPQPSSRHPSISSSTSSSSSSSRPSSLIEQEKQRSLEKQRQEVASLQKQQAAHAEERKRREKEWEARERELEQREAQLQIQEDEVQRKQREYEEEKQDLQNKKEEYQRDLAQLRDSQKRLEREREQMQRDAEQIRLTQEQRKNRTPSTTSEESSKCQSLGSLDRDPSEVELSTSPSSKDFLSRMGSKRKGKNRNPFSSNSSQKSQTNEAQSQMPSRLLQLTKPKEKKDKKKKKGKGHQSQTTEPPSTVVQDATTEGEIFFC